MTNLSLKMLFCCCFFTVSLSAAAQNIELDCPCGFAIQGASVTLTADAVINPRNGGRSGTLKLKLWATSSPYSGGSISGHIVGEYRFSDALNGGFRYTDLDRTVAYDRPPDGIYYMTMVVTEFNNGQDFIQDYITFDRTLTVGNGGTGAGGGGSNTGGGGSNTASIELDCPCGYTISGASVNLRADAVVNPRNGGHSGTLKLKLWATSSPYSGGSISGHIVGEYRFSDALNGGFRYTDLDRTVAYDRPPDGIYYMTMVVTEFNNGQDFIQDYITFDRTLTVGNGGTGAGGGGSNTASIELDCPCGYTISGASVNLRADAVVNPRNGGHSGTLKLKLWATSSPYSGGNIRGHIVGEYQFRNTPLNGGLNGGRRFTDVDRTVTYDRPPDGTYYMTMTVTEFNGQGDIIQDYITFDRTLTVGNGGTGAGGGGSELDGGTESLGTPASYSFSNSQLTIPAIEVQSGFGSVYYEVILGLHNLSPLQFTIAEITELNGPGSALVSTYNNGLLTIPVVVVDDTRFYLELILNEVQGVPVFELMYVEEILN